MRGIILVLAAVSAWGQAPGPFTLTDLGVLTGFGGCIATTISPNGQVAGYCHAARAVIHTGPPTRGFLYADGAMTALPGTTGTTLIEGINDAGTVVGVSLPAGTSVTQNLLGNFFMPFIYPAGAVSPPARFWPSSINATTLSGFYSSLNPNILAPNDLLQAAMFAGQLQVLPGATGANSLGFGISQKGIIAGTRLTVDPNTFGVTMGPILWQNATPLFLPSSSEDATIALAVNDEGMAVGAGFNLRVTPDFVDPLASYTLTDLRALYWNQGVLNDATASLGTRYGMFSGVNATGWAVGFGTDAFPSAGLGILDPLTLYPDDPGFRGFVFAAGQSYDLNTLVTGAEGWTITNATAINDAGQIVGAGFLNGTEHAILLTPAEPPPPGPVIGGISGGGLSVPPVTSISANGYFTIGGANFAPDGTSRQLEGGDIMSSMLPTNLASTCVDVGTSRAFLSFVSPTQINALGPAMPAGGMAAVRVVANCDTEDEMASDPVMVAVEAASPEFLYWVQNADGQNPVIALDAVHGDYIGPEGLIAGLTFRPAKAGDILTLYGVSFGPTMTGPVPGAIPTAADSLPEGFSVTIGGIPAEVGYAGVTPGSAGLYQVNLTVPEGLAPGIYSIVLTVNGVSTPVGGFLVVG